jgi:hypothetical protein
VAVWGKGIAYPCAGLCKLAAIPAHAREFDAFWYVTGVPFARLWSAIERRVQWPTEAALAPPRTALAFVSDLVLAFVWCLVYGLSRPSWGRSKIQLALASADIVWLGGVARDVMEINGGYLPLDISIMTTVLELATFVVVAPLLPRLLPDPVVTAT